MGNGTAVVELPPPLPAAPPALPVEALLPAVVVRADASSKRDRGRRLDPSTLSAGRNLGSGSFGECYVGTLSDPKSGEQRQVVLKRVKARVRGADEMHEAEHLLNVLASKAAPTACAPFLGYALVDSPVGRLTKGLWLCWEFGGDKTLAYYLKRRDMERCLAADLGVEEEEEAVPTVMKQLFECLVALHKVGIVHRDIKPANIVFDERLRRFRLIDLGAAACLRTGTNYKPAETILDPCYCPPEEYVLPTDAPHLGDAGTRLRTVMTPLLWSQHKPDCFDTYSAGIVLMQLSLPFLRTTSSLRTFNGALARCSHDLEEWRARSGLPARQTATLDANDGAGWELAAALLRPRRVVTDDEGGVKFLNTGKAPRLTAAQALRHPFIRAAGAPSAAAAEEEKEEGSGSRGRAGSAGRSRGSAGRSAARSGSGSGGRGGAAAAPAARAAKAKPGGGALASMWGGLKSRLFDLEARVLKEATATEVQTTVVQQLRQEVAAGRAPEAELRREQAALADMQRSLASSVKEMNSVYGAAKGFLSGILGGGGSRGQQQKKKAAGGAEAAPAPAAAPADRRLPKWAAREVPLERVDSGLARQQQQAAQQQQQAAAQQQPAAAASSSYESSWQEDEDDYGDAAAAAAAAEAAGTAAAAAVGGIARGAWRLGSSALTGLAAFAAGLKEEAQRNAAAAAAEAALQKQAAQAYLEALQGLQPPLTAASRYETEARRVAEAPAFAVLSDVRREQVFSAYIDALAKAERAARQRAQAAFQELLVEAEVGEQTGWAEFAGAHAADPRFTGLAAEEDRQAAFEAHAAKLRAAREAEERRAAAAAAAAERAAAREAARAEREAERAQREAARAHEHEAAFRALMKEHEDDIASGLGYAQVKLALFPDPRYDEVPEERRRQLYDEYYAILTEAGRVPGGASEAAAAAAAGGAKEAPAAAAAGSDALDWLRTEQARLKEEYARMEAKLRAMESRLRLDGGSSGAPAPPPSGPAATAELAAQALEAAVEREGETVGFQFHDGMPSAADFSKSLAGKAHPAGEEAAVAVNGANGAGGH